ncbi:MAG: uracil-DNA glycosylase [Pseudomonadota bacterium]
MSLFDLSRLGAWRDLPFFDEDLPDIEEELKAETRPVFPPPNAVFHALERCQPAQVRVVLFGQDPYHTPGKADGLAFSIPTGFPGRLDSLGNIFRELESDIHLKRRRTDLSDWADEGVLLFNPLALTVPQGQPKGHVKLGWQKLTAQVLGHLADHPRVYLLWGRPAQDAARRVADTDNLKLLAPHPSPLSAHRGFFGSRPFSRANAWLQARGIPPINWGDPEGP